LYLKKRGMRYSEIGRVLDRDERNIWKVYNKVKHEEINLSKEVISAGKLLDKKSKVENYNKERFVLLIKLLRKSNDSRVLSLVLSEYNELSGNKHDSIIPISIFSREIGVLESIVKYMKENLKMTYKEISERLGRDERTIWSAYSNSVKKKRKKFLTSKDKFCVSLNVFKKELTALESIVYYLKEDGMRYSEIGKVLDRDERNIWKVYKRAKEVFL